jgi:hypothetical protein
MDGKEARNTLLFWIGFGIFILIAGYCQRKSKTPVVNTNNLPPRDESRHAMYYDFRNQIWVYEGERDSRAKSSNEPSDRYKDLDKDLDKYLDEQTEDYLNEHVKGYKAKHFWGQHDVDVEETNEDEEADTEIGDEPED